MTCRICANDENNPTYLAREMMFGFRDEFRYFQCSRCGCLQIAEVPEDIAKYYPAHYYSFARPDVALRGRRRRLRGLPRRMRDRYAILGRGRVGRLLYRIWPNPSLREWTETRFPGDGVKEVGLTRGSRILDVGCGSGDFLLALHAAGFPSLQGIDAYLAGDAEYPGGLRILKRSVHEVRGEWDLVMFHHSFEHMADPREVLGAAARLLAVSGTCLIRLPLVSSYAWEHYGVDWVQLDAPRHFFLHSLESLTRLAGDAGLAVSKVVCDSSAFQFVGSELYRRDIPLRPVTRAEIDARESAFTREEMEAFQRQAAVLNAQGRGDQAAIYMKRALASK